MIAPESFATGEQNHAASCQGIPCARESGILKSGIRRQIFLPSRARLTSRCPPAPHARNLENPVVPTLLARGSRHAFLVQCVDGVAGPAACGNKILTIFAPYTFSHNQGQVQTDFGAQIKLVAWSLVLSRADVRSLTPLARAGLAPRNAHVDDDPGHVESTISCLLSSLRQAC